MISVTKDFTKIPAKLLTPQCQDLIQDAILNPSKHKFKSDYYSGGSKDELEKIYNNKCCFCESDPSPSAFWRVEHFRPKNKAPNNSPYGNHNGYSWLGYEWSNLLLICEKCNNKKSSHFPLFNEANRMVQHALDQNHNPITLIKHELYQNEGNVLLNPEVDKVEDFFIFKPDGDIVGIDPEGRGEMSIKLYNLRRERLMIARHKISDEYFDEIKSCLADYLNGQLPEQSLFDVLNLKFRTLVQKSVNPKLEYSRVWYFMFDKFHLFAKYHLPNQQDFNLVMARFNKFLGK
ncbi:MAG TPA: hypothetical protein VK169_08815 [Saprospiraceae bacterium]|nr:hypothetical protein [Saprospiraceae bacterium]